MEWLFVLVILIVVFALVINANKPEATGDAAPAAANLSARITERIQIPEVEAWLIACFEYPSGIDEMLCREFLDDGSGEINRYKANLAAKMRYATWKLYLKLHGPDARYNDAVRELNVPHAIQFVTDMRAAKLRMEELEQSGGVGLGGYQEHVGSDISVMLRNGAPYMLIFLTSKTQSFCATLNMQMVDQALVALDDMKSKGRTMADSLIATANTSKATA